MKTDSNGNPSWRKTYEFGSLDYSYSIQQTTDGGYIMSGTSSFSIWENNTLVMKLNNGGEIPDCDFIATSDVDVSDTSVVEKDSNATVQVSSATVTDTDVIPDNTSFETITLCEGESVEGLPVVWTKNGVVFSA